MRKKPLNYLLTAALGAVLWVVFAILLGQYLSSSPTLSTKDPTQLASELQIIFGSGVIISILSAWYWYFYGSQENTAGELNIAKRKWMGLFIFQIILSVILIVVIVIMNRDQGIEPKWHLVYFSISALLTFILFWAATLIMSPNTVRTIPIGQ